jgi:hypothetical protein
MDPAASLDELRRGLAHRSLPRPGRRLALAGGAVAFVAMAAALPLAAIAHHFSHALPIFLASAPFAAVGCLVAYRQPRNSVGWLMLAMGTGTLVGLAAVAYSLLRYQFGHPGLPLGPVAAFVTPLFWASLLLLLPLPLLLFPEGKLTRPWRWVMRSYVVVAAMWVLTLLYLDIDGLVRPLNVDSSGSFALVNHPPAGWAKILTEDLVTFAYAVLALAGVGRQVFAFRGSTGEYRQQLKWLLGAGTVSFLGLFTALVAGSSPTGVVVADIGLVAIAALPIAFGIAILKYRLYDIDRLISRTISYTIVTGLLVALFTGLVLVSTRALPFSSPVGVAGATLAAAALFSPLRRRTQRVVDRRFNRRRYDAEATVAAFTEQLRNAIDPDAIRSELLRAASLALEPSRTSLWVRRD